MIKVVGKIFIQTINFETHPKITIFSESVPIRGLGWILKIWMNLENCDQEGVRSSNPFDFIRADDCVDPDGPSQEV